MSTEEPLMPEQFTSKLHSESTPEPAGVPLMDERDRKMLPWVNEFNPYDLY